MTVQEFIRREASLPPYPGACCRMIDHWFVARLGFSALVRFGRDFETDEDVKQWLAEPGGIAVAVNRVMRAAGFRKTNEPGAGDVALIIHRGRICMALNDGSRWVSRDDQGMIGVPLGSPCKAWKLV